MFLKNVVAIDGVLKLDTFDIGHVSMVGMIITLCSMKKIYENYIIPFDVVIMVEGVPVASVTLPTYIDYT